MKVKKKSLDCLVRRVVELAHPLRVIVFGSAARGDMGPDSDVDLLVVMPEGTPRRKTAQELYCRMEKMPLPFDLLVATPSDLERYKDSPGLIYGAILREGVEVYAA